MSPIRQVIHEVHHLAQALVVVDPAEVGAVLARMELDPGTPLTEDVARDLAIREGEGSG